MGSTESKTGAPIAATTTEVEPHRFEDLVICGIEDQSHQGYIVYNYCSNEARWGKGNLILKYSNNKFSDLYRKIENHHAYKFEYTVESTRTSTANQYCVILDVFDVDEHELSGRIDDFLDIKDSSIHNTMRFTAKYMEVILEKRPIKCEGRDGFVRLIIEKDRVKALSKHVKYEFKAHLFANTNRYLIGDITVVKS